MAAPPSVDAQRAARVVLRPIASPFALGFVGLAGATLVTSGLDLGWFGDDERTQAAIVFLAFAPLLQLIASVFGFLARDAIAATGMGVLAGSWLVIGLVTLTTAPNSTSDVLGAFLLVAGVALLAVAASAVAYKLVPAVVVGAAGMRFVLSGLHELTAASVWEDLSGIVGLVLCVAALYAAVSLEIEDVRHDTLLPTLRRGEGREALDADLAGQTSDVAVEAGVRKQL